MNNTLRAIAPRSVWSLCFLLSACQSYLPVTVQVLDAESRANSEGQG
jgi:hypothetical protein